MIEDTTEQKVRVKSKTAGWLCGLDGAEFRWSDDNANAWWMSLGEATFRLAKIRLVASDAKIEKDG